MYKTFDAGYFIFPASMAPDKGELNGCIKIHGVTSCSYMGAEMIQEYLNWICMIHTIF